MLGKLRVGRHLDGNAGARRYVIKYARDIHAVGDLVEMLNQPFLRALIVIRRHKQQPVRPDFFRVLRKLDRVSRIVRPGAGDDRHAPFRMLDGKLDGFLVLRVAHCRGLARSARDNDSVRMARNLRVDHAPELGKIDAVLGERRDDGDARALEDQFLHKRLLLFVKISLIIMP